ncbi:TetR/AcrR family transcriptional regulator [Streptomyces sp. NBC_01477]|uniref:TetR/AcrR family transcriptional regulator n=1 Tax=Streptomyces sp. NBC_01477 TaxID=2976015 RepID=UPI002E37BF05|nr:helix-turn-helix domain-containing protein [Streptomyces sp. NBC_01477]
MAHGGGSAPVPRRARRADAARNAELLLSAAKDLFGEHGPEVALDEVARRAGLGNATLYRHFPTRGDLLVAVYADEVAELCRGAAALTDRHPPGDALFAWLDDFVVHVATKRALALAVTEGPDERRTELFERWHGSMRSTAEVLLSGARAAGAVRDDLAVGDLLALVSGAAMTAADGEHARRLLGIMRHGFEPPARPSV